MYKASRLLTAFIPKVQKLRGIFPLFRTQILRVRAGFLRPLGLLSPLPSWFLRVRAGLRPLDFFPLPRAPGSLWIKFLYMYIESPETPVNRLFLRTFQKPPSFLISGLLLSSYVFLFAYESTFPHKPKTPWTLIPTFFYCSLVAALSSGGLRVLLMAGEERVLKFG